MRAIDVEPGAKVRLFTAAWDMAAILRDCCTLPWADAWGEVRSAERRPSSSSLTAGRWRSFGKGTLRRRGMRLAGTLASEATHPSEGPVNEETAE